MKKTYALAVALAATAASLGTAQAARYQLTYTDTFEETSWTTNPETVLDTQTATLTAYFDGTLQGDNDTIFINSWEAGATLNFNGSVKTLPALPKINRKSISLSGNICSVYVLDFAFNYYVDCAMTGSPRFNVWNVTLEYIASYEPAKLSVSLAPVPEPSTALLGLLGLPALLAACRRKAR